MKKVNWWLIAAYIAVIGLVVLFARPAKGQNVIRKGNVFVQQESTQHSGAEFSGYFYESKDSKDSIFVSSKGNAFIWKVSKNTGKRYRKYLPEITKKLKDEKK